MTRKAARLMRSILLAGTALWSLQTTSAGTGATLEGSAPGPYGVGHIATLVLHDPTQDKDLQLRVTYPEAPDRTFPVIVWSHGAKGTKDMYGVLIDHWASHGYIAIQANHSESRAFGFRQSKQETFRDWESRPRDLVFILDSLDAIEDRLPAAAGRMDRDRIGVGGHSFGAHTAQLIGGAEVRPSRGGVRSFRDERVDAVILLSPQGSGSESLLDSGSWSRMNLPAISITGSNDLGRTGKPWTWRLEPFLNAPPQDKYLVFIEGAHHGFGGIVGVSDFPNAGPDDPEQAAIVKAVTLWFWDAYLKGSGAARERLTSDMLRSASGGEARIFPGGTDASEIRAVAARSAQPALGGGGPPSADTIVTHFDRDGDGQLTRQEMPPRLAPAFDHLDADRSGAVSADELAQGLRALDGRRPAPAWQR